MASGRAKLSAILIKPLALTSGLLLALACPAARAAVSTHAPVDAADDAPREEPGMLRVTVASEIVDADLIPGWIAERNSRINEQVPSFEEHEQWIAVDVAGATYDYRITVIPMRDGVAVGAKPPPAACACNSEKLLMLIDEQIARAVEQLQTAPIEPEPEIAPIEPLVESETTSEPEPPPSPPDRRRISGLGITGAIATSLGASAVVGGVVMMAMKSDVLPDAILTERYLRYPGGITLAAGGAVLAAGVTMLVVDVIQCRKSDAPHRCERRNGKSNLEVGPTFGARSGGVTLFGRF